MTYTEKKFRSFNARVRDYTCSGYEWTCEGMTFSAMYGIPIYREGLDPMEAYILPCEEALRNMHYASIKILG